MIIGVEEEKMENTKKNIRLVTVLDRVLRKGLMITSVTLLSYGYRM